MTKRNKIIIGGIFAAVVLPLIVGAASVWSQERFVLEQGETRAGNVYAISQDGFVAGKVEGDLVMAGGSSVVTGEIKDDLLIAAGNTQISGSIGGDARLVTGESTVTGSIGGDLVLVGGKAYITGGSSVGGDLLVLGGELTLEGAVKGRARISGGEIIINGPIDGNLEVQGGRLTIGEKAIIGGNLRFRGPQAPMIAPGAIIQGKTEFIRDDFGNSRFRYFAHGMGVLAGAAGLLMSLILALVFFGCFKERVRALTHSALTGFWPHVGRGLLTLILLPIIALVIMATIIGFPIGAFGMLLFGLGMILTMALSGTIFGSWVMRVIFKKGEHQPTTATVIWGTVALRLITFIPVIGWIVGLIFCSVSFGVLAHGAYHRFWVGRK